MSASTINKETTNVTIIFNGIISQSKIFTFDISEDLIKTIPFLDAILDRWIKCNVKCSAKNIIELNMDPKNNIIPSSIEKYFDLKKQITNPTFNISTTFIGFDIKRWIDLLEIIVHFADFTFYDQSVKPYLPSYDKFRHSIDRLPEHITIQFGEKYFNDCLQIKSKCDICNNRDYYCEEKEQFDQLTEDIKSKIYSVLSNGCSIHNHNSGSFNNCNSKACPDRSFKLDGWTRLEIGHLLRNLECYMKRLNDIQKKDFKSFTIDDLCTCQYSFDDTFIKFTKTNKEWATFVWDYCDKTELLSPFKLEQDIIDNIVTMKYDQLFKYIDQNVWKTPKNTFKSK